MASADSGAERTDDESRSREGARVLAAAIEQAPDETTAALVREYWALVPPEELPGRTPDDLLAAVASHRELAAERTAGQLSLRVHTPDPYTQRWAGGHTLVEIVTDDMPFLVDSVTAELNRHELEVHLLAHPQLVVRRELFGSLEEIRGGTGSRRPVEGDLVESWMHIEVDRTRDPAELEELANDLRRVLTDVREAVEDWPKMRETAVSLADELDLAEMSSVPEKDIEDAQQLLRWLADDHFTFLGYREYRLVGGEDNQDETVLEAVPGTGLGILRQDQAQGRSFASMPSAAREQALEKRLLIITKANSRATVHRTAYLDYLGFKIFDASGEVIGERRFLGLFASAAYLESVRALPVISRKVREVIRRSGLSVRSHSGKDLMSVLEQYPRDELFQCTTDKLYETAMGVLRLAGRRHLRVFLRRDSYGRFISCLVYLPRDRYTTKNRLRMQRLLTEALSGVGVDYAARVTESQLAQVLFTVRTDPANPPDLVDMGELQAQLTAATRSWDDDFAVALEEAVGEEQSRALLRRYGQSFPEAYKEEHTVAEAVDDIARLEMLEEGGDLGAHLYRRDGDVRFTVCRLTQPMSLSDVLPVLQSLGVRVHDERPFKFHRGGGSSSNSGSGGDLAWVYDFGLGPCSGVDVDAVRGAVQNAFAAAWRGESEVDGLNPLVLSAGLTWHQITILRAYAKYLRQAGTIYSNEFISATLANNPEIAAALVRLFVCRFDPELSDDARAESTEKTTAELATMLDGVESLEHDRILRSIQSMMMATRRTTFFRRGNSGRPLPYLAMKLDSTEVPDLPLPRPKFEIFVYSPRFEGVHLRFGMVARGGLRWSDRREDFRTEVLGLVKAQMVKNSVIVPVGAKGGFVLKHPPAPGDREALAAEGVACYRMFISALLDVTDNIRTLPDGSTEVVPPPNVVRHDDDDTYLVVAADKGTATFSDVANEISQRYGFWLSDAFASGGSVGYDHKKMGITAKGAWESVKRHFRETGHDTQTTDFTVAGVGDMSGDVFGNGMLLSEHIRLVAAFDHRHIFIDPNPDAATSYAERRRIFELPRSSWDDYDRSLISAGGGVFPRTAKSIPITAEMRAALGIEDSSVVKLSPAELMRTILTAPVDLFWNGGIGTYVKASSETHADVGDKANDTIRVNGDQLRCKVVGEGGNLGLTQLGRIEYAAAGGRINTDAIDNSAGVDASDHEVNIKILLDRAVAAGALSGDERNDLLAAMTDEVGELVLADNYEQNTALGNSRQQAASLLTVHKRMIKSLEKTGRLDREIEFLPSDKEIDRREEAGLGMTSPELSVLLAYAKIDLEAKVAASDLPDEPWAFEFLVDYFPRPLREKYRDLMEAHPLRRQIITTRIVNDCVNRGGISFVFRASEETGSDPIDVVRAAESIRQVFGLRAVIADGEALDNQVPTSAQTAVYLASRRLLDRAVRWLLQNRRPPLDVVAEVNRFQPGITELLPRIDGFFGTEESEALGGDQAKLVEMGVPTELATRAARLLYGFGLLDVLGVAQTADRPTDEVARVYYELRARLHVDGLLERIAELPRDNRWQALARMSLRYDLYSAIAELTTEVVNATAAGAEPGDRVTAWAQANASALERVQANLRDAAELKSDLATLSVLLRQIRTVVRAGIST